MGCDIHTFTEGKRTVNNEKEWVNVDYWQINPYRGEEGEPDMNIKEVYWRRNYNLFANLANVRNYHDNKVISEPKGMPKNMHSKTKEEVDRWGADGHSHSWLTLKELKDFYKENGITKHEGLMHPEDAERVDKGEMPYSWCQATNVEGYVFREWDSENHALKNLISAIEERKKEYFWIFKEGWVDDKDEDFRLVFFFDN